MLPVVVTLILFVTSLAINENDGFLKSRRSVQSREARRELECKRKVDEAFVTFVQAFKANYSRITDSINHLINGIVSIFSSSFML